MRLKKVGSAWLAVFAVAATVEARPWRPAQVPNGAQFNCGVCHVNRNSGGARNPFGRDVEMFVARNSRADFWGAALAALDSDGDGVANGVELGDPDGTWTPGTANPTGDITEPGNAESFPDPVTEPPGPGTEPPGENGLRLSPVADTSLWEPFANNNLGASDDFPAGTTRSNGSGRGLLRFSFDDVPENARIVSVTLAVNAVRTPSGGPSSVFALHRVLVPWEEGGQSGRNGAAAAAGEPTWQLRMAPDVEWGAPGGLIGADVAEAVSASVTVEGDGEYQFESTSETVADVQAWIDDASVNHGWMLLSQSEGTPQTVRRFASRESATGAPFLDIEWEIIEPEPEPGTLAIALDGGEVRVTWDFGRLQSAAGAGGPWADVPDAASPFVAPASDAARFYRTLQ